MGHFLTRQQMAAMIDGENRDLDKVCGYPAVITPALYRRMYDREGVAARVVNCMPEETWAEDPIIYETESTERETDFEQQWDELNVQHSLLHYLQRIDILSGIGRFGLLLMGIDDGEDLNVPVQGVVGDGVNRGNKYQLLYLRAFDESVCVVQDWEKDRSNPRYGQPTLYGITFQDEGGSSITSSVHWSRVLHVADDRRMSEVYGTPRMEGVFNRLFDIRKVLGSSGEMFWQGGFPGMSFEMDPELVESGVEIDKDAVRREFEDYVNGLKRWLAVEGLRVKTHSPEVADPTPHVEANLKAVAIAKGIPFRILWGSEQAQLASAQDARNWAKRLKKRQTYYVTPLIVRPFVHRLVEFGALAQPKEVKVDWPDLASLSDLEKAQVAKEQTTAMATYLQGRVDQMISPRAFLHHVMQFDMDTSRTLIDEAVVDLQDEYEGDEEDFTDNA